MIGEVLRDLLRYIPSRVLPAIAALAAIPVLTRLLPPGQYGHYTLAMAAAGLFSSVTAAWITSSAIRFVPAYERERRLDQGLGLLLRIFGASAAVFAVVAATVLAIMAGRGAIDVTLALAALLMCLALASQDFLMGLLRSRRRAATFSVLTSISGVAGYALAVTLALALDAGALAVVSGFALAIVLVLPFTARSAFGGTRPASASLRSPDAREVLRYGLPALAINALTWLTTLSDRYVLAGFTGADAVGIYAASRDLTDKGILLFNSMFLLASTPVGMSVWEQQGEEPARAYQTRVTRAYLLLGVPLAIGIAVLARPLVTVLADARYHDGYRLVPLVAVGGVLAGLAQRFTLGLGFRKRTDLLALPYVGAAVVNVGLNLALVPRYGFMAAAAANLLASLLLLVFTRAIATPVFTWPFPVRSALRVCTAGAAMGAAVWAVVAGIGPPAAQLAAGVAVGVVSYGAMLVALGEVGPDERAALARYLRPR